MQFIWYFLYSYLTFDDKLAKQLKRDLMENWAGHTHTHSYDLQ